MRRVRREAGGGEVAMMAVITKAMGAFIVLVVMLIPYYSVNIDITQQSEQAKRKVEDVRTTVKAMQETLGKGRLTDKEIDALQRQIKQLQASLDEAFRQIEALNTRLQQFAAQIQRLQKKVDAQAVEIARLLSQVEPLKKEVARQAEEIDALKAENERLRKYTAGVSFELVWSNCPGARFEIDVQVYPADATAQTPVTVSRRSRYATKDAASKLRAATMLRLDDAAGIDRFYVKGDRLAGSRFLVFGKRINALPFEDGRCDLILHVLHGSDIRSQRSEALRRSVIAELGAFEVVKDVVEQVEFSTDEKKRVRAALDAGTCDPLMCRPAQGKVPPDQLQANLSRYLETFDVPDQVSNELVQAVVTRLIEPAAMYRWAQAVLDVRKVEPNGSTSVRPDLTKLLAAKGAPDISKTFLLTRIATLPAIDRAELVERIRSWPVTLSPKGAKIADLLVEAGMSEELARRFASAAGSTHDAAGDWPKVFQQAKVGGQKRYDSLRGRIRSHPKVERAGPDLANVVADVLTFAVDNGSTTEEDVLTALGGPDMTGLTKGGMPRESAEAWTAFVTRARGETKDKRQSSARLIKEFGFMPKEVSPMPELKPALATLLANEIQLGNISADQVEKFAAARKSSAKGAP